MRFRLKTPGQSLCHTCRHSHVVTLLHAAQEMVRCHYGSSMEGLAVGPGAQDCNKHEPLTAMTEWEARERGWVLEVKAGKIIGFRPPTKKEAGED